MTDCARVAGTPPGSTCGSGSGAGRSLATVSLFFALEDFEERFFEVGAAIAVVQMQQTSAVHSCHRQKTLEPAAILIALIV
ncbi:MAG TPA: hypothetical protein VF683_06285 [Chthoniobacterales bacterium]|jgi:hypothetical protein